MRSNFHTHTYRCKHASGTERDYVEAAAANGLSVLGFSDHGPFPHKDFGLRMQFSELKDYSDTIRALSIEYSNIRLYAGLEIEYLPDQQGYYQQLLNDGMMDYLALGQHFYIAEDGSQRFITSAKSTADYLDYAKSIVHAMETGCFAFVAHPDLMFRNNFAWDRNCTKACEMILLAAEKYRIPLEFNANGLRRGKSIFVDGKRYSYPHERFWNNLKGSKQKVIIGADCHQTEQVYDNAIRLAEELCTKADLNVITDLFM